MSCSEITKFLSFAVHTNFRNVHFTARSAACRIHQSTGKCWFFDSYLVNWSRSQPFQSKDELSYHLTAHLRMNAVYWGLTALCIMGHKDALDRDEMVDFVMSCWDEEAGLF